ncbi:hypothetical protein D6C88_00846, partial [Aureobasidium pullulans]
RNVNTVPKTRHLSITIERPPYAKLCHLDSQAVAMRIVPPIKMHNDFKKEHIVHRERLSDALSLDVALLSWQALAHGDGGYSIWRTAFLSRVCVEQDIMHRVLIQKCREASDLQRQQGLEFLHMPPSAPLSRVCAEMWRNGKTNSGNTDKLVLSGYVHGERRDKTGLQGYAGVGCATCVTCGGVNQAVNILVAELTLKDVLI